VNDRPRLTIGLPVYNGGRFLRETLDSLLSQTFSDFELIISDNASTDDTERICREYAAKDSRILYYRQEYNRGAAWNHNTLVELAKGEYFKWAMADDVCAPELVERCIEVLDRNQDTVLACVRTMFVDEGGNVIRKIAHCWDLQSDKPHERFKAVMNIGGHWANADALAGVTRYSAMAATGLLPHYQGGDKRPLAELSLVGKFHEIPEYLYFRRQHAGASSHHNPEFSKNRNENIEWMFEFFKGSRWEVALPTWSLWSDYLGLICRCKLPLKHKVFLLIALLRCVRRSHKLLLNELKSVAGQSIRYWRFRKVGYYMAERDQVASKHAKAAASKSGFFCVPQVETTKGSLDDRITAALKQIHEPLGLSKAAVADAVHKELNCFKAKQVFDYLPSEGISIRGARILDLGAGLGCVSVEGTRRGACTIALEPGDGCREIVAERIKQEGTGHVLAAAAENLPFPDGSFDGVISLQVLEHVRNPEAVLQEVYRVLKPGGFMYLTCENYIAFREPHYHVAWLPLLPKSLGAVYLRLRGRSPHFLLSSITYTTLPRVRKILDNCGFISVVDRDIRSRIERPLEIQTLWKRWILQRAVRIFSTKVVVNMAKSFESARKLFNPVIYELCWKPAPKLRPHIRSVEAKKEYGVVNA
jgi:glycosyltransferase involved in cell wall biosynthesis/ubiquinone/menaquinone biosynthesis C-methylase UbiE